ncbi:hypothetical protein FIBSPDRAFT_853507 [Athelia psychrophila]|uniref:DUF1774-domain-containing protein n=1 Tax=Athelia psychrophila TaxID=1759441 RepID=A0A166QWS5_9AGAM|nr:hypothetical protein FIBSPDRAFT_853507 [Fibularhizoctonia sp. CBS 109695]
MVNPQLVRARILALGSFIINFSCQLYGSLAKPNMKDIADANHYAFSPHPYFIAAFFSFQALFQLYWIAGLFKAKSASPSPKYEHRVTLGSEVPGVNAYAEGEPEPAQMAYVPIYALGNLCIAGWMVFWMQENFWASQTLVVINSTVQLYAVLSLLSPSSPFRISTQNWKTHLVANTFAGVGVLDFIDNGGVALKLKGPPSATVQAATVAAFLVLHLVSRASPDPTFTLCLAYDVLGLWAGHPGEGSWRWILAGLAAVLGVGAAAQLRSAKTTAIGGESVVVSQDQ